MFPAMCYGGGKKNDDNLANMVFDIFAVNATSNKLARLVELNDRTLSLSFILASSSFLSSSTSSMEMLVESPIRNAAGGIKFRLVKSSTIYHHVISILSMRCQFRWSYNSKLSMTQPTRRHRIHKMGRLFCYRIESVPRCITKRPR